jgi:SNF2 family DNA or RNA helicase
MSGVPRGCLLRHLHRTGWCFAGVCREESRRARLLCPFRRITVVQPFDVRNYSDPSRQRIANTLRLKEDFKLPRLSAWNYDLCRAHAKGWVEDYYDPETDQDLRRVVTDRPKPGCRKCGIHFRAHQRTGIAWLYWVKRGLLADPMGTGKTTHAGGLLAMLLETGELGYKWEKDKPFGARGRAIIVPRAPALMQWYTELLRMIPSLDLIMASGSKSSRNTAYASGWQVLLISPQTFHRDREELMRFDYSVLITDDIDAIRNADTDTAYDLKRIGRKADRMIEMTGTPFQKNIKELWSTLDAIGGLEVFGPQDTFEKRYTKRESVAEYDRAGKLLGYRMATTYKNLAQVKELMAPMVLRRAVEDLKDVNLPVINPTDVMLDLYPRQRAKYDELRRGVLTIMKEQGAEIKHVTALTQLHYGAQICGGLATLGEEDGPNSSVKMDWLLAKISNGGELEEEKVVVFANYKNTVRALQNRFNLAGVGFETVWGEVRDKNARAASQERFWEDKKCRVLIGTQAIEQSLNLQVARHLVNVDMIMNPARMAQLAGRIRRDGSAHPHVFVHNLLTVNTQEERYLPLLEREAALASFMWDENDQLFQSLRPTDMLRLITG